MRWNIWWCMKSLGVGLEKILVYISAQIKQQTADDMIISIPSSSTLRFWINITLLPNSQMHCRFTRLIIIILLLPLLRNVIRVLGKWPTLQCWYLLQFFYKSPSTVKLSVIKIKVAHFVAFDGYWWRHNRHFYNANESAILTKMFRYNIQVCSNSSVAWNVCC